MARLNRQQISFTPLGTQLPAILLAVIVSAFGGVLQAAPVTMRFDATVGPPRQGVNGTLPPSWNTSLQQGDTVSGTFKFEPFDAASNSYTTALVQPFDFSIQIKSRTLTTSQYGIEVFNDVMADDVPMPYDSIHFGCSFFGGGVVCAPPTTSADESIEWAFGIAAFGDSMLLDGADIPADPIVWQRFVSDNTMLVTFNDSVEGFAYGFLATIDSMQAVPEPGMCLSFFVGIIFVVSSRHAIRRNCG
jgi:hypothetical protein